MTIDSLSAPAVADPSLSFLPIVVLAMAVLAAAVASVQRAGEIARLRSELDELRDSALQAAQAARSGSRSPARGRAPILAGLYDRKPGLFEGLGGSGSVLATAAAALLALAGGGLMWRDIARHQQTPVVAPAELALIQHTQDSLGTLVAQLNDSLRLIVASASTKADTRSTSRSVALAKPPRKVATPTAIPAIPPPPSLNSGGLGTGVQPRP